MPSFFELPNDDSDGSALWTGCQSRPAQVQHLLLLFLVCSIHLSDSNKKMRMYAQICRRNISTPSHPADNYRRCRLQATSSGFTTSRFTKHVTHVQVHYMYGATFGQQSKHLRLWIQEDMASGPKPAKLDFIVSVMFWIAVPYVSQARSFHDDVSLDICWSLPTACLRREYKLTLSGRRQWHAGMGKIIAVRAEPDPVLTPT